MDLDALAARLRAGGVGTVVATLGTTGLGAVDDVAAIADLCAEHGARLHVDAAYGGFFTLSLADGAATASRPWRPRRSRRSRAPTRVVVDPHKHGLQPYGCGCVLFADPGVGRLYAHDSPYTYFTSDDLHLGEISLECSRAGAAAAALWTTLRALPLTRDGLGATSPPRARPRCAAAALADDPRRARGRARARHRLPAAGRARPPRSAPPPSGRSTRSPRTAGTSRSCASTPTGCAARHPQVEPDAPAVTVLRCCLLKQEHAGVAAALAPALAAHLDAARVPA